MKSTMKTCIAAAMSAVAVLGLAIDAEACTAVLVGKDASTTGRVILGHNEDDDPSLVVRHGYVPPREWPAGATLVDHPDCAKVPRGPHSLGFFWTEVRDAKCGAGSAVSFVNEKGVAIVSDNAGPTKEDSPDSDVLTDGGIWFALRLAVAERANSAREAVEIIGALVEKWGYRPAGRTYTVADAKEGWMVQVVRGRHWVAMRCPDDAIAVMPNHYTIHAIPESPTKDSLFSTDVMAYAVGKGWWPKEREFDFALAYQDPKWVKIPHNTRRQRYVTSLLLGKEWTDESYPFSVKAARRVSPDDVKAALSSHPESGGWLRHASDFDETPSACRRQTIESLVIAFGETPADCVAQISGNRPCEKGYSTFKPLVHPLPRDLDDGDAAGRLERFFLPEPALR